MDSHLLLGGGERGSYRMGAQGASTVLHLGKKRGRSRWKSHAEVGLGTYGF